MNVVFEKFEDIEVSTKTFIAKTNLVLDLDKLFDFLPITEYISVPKKRGRKKKEPFINPNKDIIPGSIITLKFKDKLRGINLKAKKNDDKKKKGKWFRNCFTVVLTLENKNINFKVSKNGMFQITGCKVDEHSERCIEYIWDYIKDEKDIYSFSNGNTLETLYIPAMRNIDFVLGFLVDREKLARYMNTQSEFHCLLETSFGYTGVNIKIPFTKDIKCSKVKKIVFSTKGKKTESMITYNDYLDLLSPKDKEKKLKKDRYNTFLVFHSGKVIMSGMTEEFMKDSYEYFIKIINTCYTQIKETLE